MKRNLRIRVLLLCTCLFSFATASLQNENQLNAYQVNVDNHEPGLVGFWKLAGDAKDSSGNSNHGKTQNIEFTAGPTGAPNSAALFNGRDASIEIPDAKSLHLGKGDFSFSVWVKPEAKMTNIFGDIVSKFDAAKRRGINFHMAGSSSAYSSMSDTRHIHFGIDDGYLGEWKDCGKPWPSNTLITNLVVFEGELYAGIADASNPEDACKVFRWDKNTKNWIDCGRLGNDSNHLSVQSLLVHDGKLYAGTGIWYWSQAWGAVPDKPRAAKPRVFVYEGGTKWRDLGQLGEATRVISMASYNGDLYAGIDKYRNEEKKVVPGRCFKYCADAQNGSHWIDCGAPDKRNLENLMPFGGKLYCATHGNVYVYEGGKKWTLIGNEPNNIEQIHSMEAYRGRLHIGTWPQGYVLRYAGNKKWESTGRLGLPEAKSGEKEINEINDIAIHNGKVYAGVIPLSEVYRYESDGDWTMLKSLGQQPKTTRDDDRTWRRLTAMASFQGKLYAGTGSCRGSTENRDPDDTLGRVYEIEVGQIVSHEHDIGHSWTHIAVVRRGKELQLYINGKLSVSNSTPEGREFDLTNTEPMLIGLGAQNYFTGAIAELRIYNKALDLTAVEQLHASKAENKGLLGHWKLISDSKDYSGRELHGVNHGVDFTKDHCATFDGIDKFIDIPNTEHLQLGQGDFSVSVHVHTEAKLTDVLGDIVSKFDPTTRTGMTLSIMNYAGVTTSQSNYRNLSFGIDAGHADKAWADCGLPGNSKFVMGLAVYNGNLYASTFEFEKDQYGHVYRYDGDKKWTDCGLPDKANGVSSVAVYNGKLYVGTIRYNSQGSLMPPSPNMTPGGNIYRYEGGTNWTHCGKLGESDGVGSLIVYDGKLFGSTSYKEAKGLYRYDGEKRWTYCGNPGRRTNPLTVFNGALYSASPDKGHFLRYEGQQKWTDLGKAAETTNQIYSFMVYQGKLYHGIWPTASVYSYDVENNKWTSVGQMGKEQEVMGISVYNGMMYCGTLPMGKVYRFDGPGRWTFAGRVDNTPNVAYRRVWSMAVFQGKLFAGTLPSGHVYSFEAGKCVTHDHELPAGWRHIAAVKEGGILKLFVDGKCVATSSTFDPAEYDLTNSSSLKIGFGQHDYFNGKMKDLRLYQSALNDREILELSSMTDRQ